MTVQDAKALAQGQRIYTYVPDQRRKHNPSLMRWISARVTSVKTWKRRPANVEVRLVYGLKEFFTINQWHLETWELEPTHHKGDAA